MAELGVGRRDETYPMMSAPAVWMYLPSPSGLVGTGEMVKMESGGDMGLEREE